MTGETVVSRNHRAKLLRLVSNSGPVISHQDMKQNYNFLNGMPKDVRQTILRCLRSFNFDNVRISTEDIHFYLQAAEAIPGLDKIKKICEENLIQSVSAENAVYMLHTGQQFGLTSLVKETITFISVHLSNIMQREEFNTLNEEQVQEIHDLYHKTFGYENIDRKSSSKCPQKDRKVHLIFTTDRNSRLEAIIRDASTSKQYHTECRSNNGKTKKLRQNFSVCSVQEDEHDPPIILMTGGSGEQNDEVFECDVINNKWKTRKHMKFGREHHALCVVNSQVYAIGGHCCSGDKLKMVPQIEVYNSSQKAWKESASLSIPVYSPECVAVGNRIFIIGGMDENDREVNFIQIFDTIKDKITKRYPLPDGCSKGKAILVDNIIYFAAESGHLVRIDIQTLEVQHLTQQPEVSTHFSIHEWEENFMVTYHCKEKDDKLISYVYNIRHNIWTLYDKFSVRLDSLCGQCTVRYPANICHIPFCD